LKIIPAFFFAEGRTSCNEKQPSVAAPILNHRKTAPAQGMPLAGQLDFVIVSNPVPSRNPIEPVNGRTPLNFEKPEPSTVKRLGAGHQYAPGMAPKPRDPVADAAIEAYLAKHKDGTRSAPPLPVEGPPSRRQLRWATEMRSKFLVHDTRGKVALPKQINRTVIVEKLESFPWAAGVTRILVGFAVTLYGQKTALAFAGYVPAKGKRAAYDRQADADYQHYRRRQCVGSSGYNSATSVREMIYADGSNLSYQASELALDSDLEDVCAYPLCLKPLGKDRHFDSRYCIGRNCAQRDRRRLAKLKVNDANRPLRRKFSCTEVGPSTDLIDIVDVSSLTESEVIFQNTYRRGYRSFRDDPIGRLFAAGLITQDQFDAAADYMADLDEIGARLRAPHRDELDISVWIPRSPDSAAQSATEIKRSKAPSPLTRIRVANQVMGREATALLHTVLVSNTITSIELLRAVLDALITSRYLQWTKPPEKSSTRSTSRSAPQLGSVS
jgi:hypothetical protein